MVVPSPGGVALLGIAHRSIRINYVHNLRKRKWFKPLSVSIKTLGDWIQVKRQEKNLSPCHLAEKMGIATTLVQSWENGTYEPDADQIQMLNSILKFDAVIDLPSPRQ